MRRAIAVQNPALQSATVIRASDPNAAVPGDAPVFKETRAATVQALHADSPVITANSITNLHSFASIEDNAGTTPPDLGGTVGPNQVAAVLNDEIRVQSKSGEIISRTSTLGWWKGFFPTITQVADNRVVYDSLANRWLIIASVDPKTPNAGVAVAGSLTSDPSGDWYGLLYNADPTHTLWAERPQIAFNKDWIVLCSNLYTNSDTFSTGKISVITKSEVYAAGSVTSARVFTTNIGFGMTPALMLDASANLLYLLQEYSNSTARIFRLGGTVGNETLTLMGSVVVTPGEEWAQSGPAAPQLGSPTGIEQGDSRFTGAVYRNGGVWTTHTIFLPASSPTHAAVQWWQILPSSGTSMRGRIDDPAGVVSRSYPSIGVNADNAALVGYTRFSPSTYPSAAYSYRVGSDAATTMRAEQVFKAGLAPYAKAGAGNKLRWGDFSTTVVDPTNDSDLWTLQEYTTAGGSWGSWWSCLSVVRDGGYLANLSVRTFAGVGDSTLLVGVVVGGAGTSGTKPLLVRAVGPTLTGYGVAGALGDPKLDFLPQGSLTPLASNDDWGGDAQVRSAANAVGAFAFPTDTSKDAALYLNPPSGVYSVKVTGAQATTGIALAEIYDASASGFPASTPRLVNVSARAQVNTGDGVLIAGFVVAGTAPRTVLIRAVGPTLGTYGVAGALQDPVLELSRTVNGATSVVATNDNWSGDAQISNVAASVGAFSLSSSDSKDAAILVTLPPGVYSAKASGASSTTGVALIEVYEVP